MNREELLQNISIWDAENHHQEIINAIEAMPREEWGYTLTGLLARAYNNLAMFGRKTTKEQHEMLEKAVALLESVREEGQEDDRWHFRMGYALYYLDRTAEALTCFRRVRELDPEDQKAVQFIVLCENRLDMKGSSDSDESSFYITLNLNARLQPMHRGDLEDALDELLDKSDIGFVDGGGTLMSPSGEVKSCDIQLDLNDDSEETIAELESIIDALGVPKGSKLLWTRADDETIERPVGRLEGMALYLNGTDLPEEVYENSDINYVIEQLESRMDGIGRLYSWWEGSENTALYFYGESYEKMSAAIQDFIAEYPLCRKCVVERIA